MIFLIVLTTALAAALAVGALSVLFGRRQAHLERQLAGYEPNFDGGGTIAVGGGDRGDTAVVRQAVDMTERLARRAGFFEKVERALEQADLNIRASELLFYTLAGGVFAFLVFAIFVSPLVGLIAAVVIGLAPAAEVSRRRRKRLLAFERQLPDTLTLLSSSLRAGFSFMQGLESIAQEIGEPMRRELQRVFTEVRLGRAVEDALADAADRMNSRDFAWAVMAIKIQREVGGNLATLLDTVADTMQKRERVRREIRALTAEGRISAIILGALPFVAGIGLFLVAHDYMKSLFDHTVGVVALIGAGVLALLGFVWLRKLLDIEV